MSRTGTRQADQLSIMAICGHKLAWARAQTGWGWLQEEDRERTFWEKRNI